MGHSTAATSFYATALGAYTKASGDASVAMGYGTTASGIKSTAMGKETLASGSFSTAMGRGTNASGASSVASGRLSKAEGEMSTAMGHHTTAQSYAEVVLGQFNRLSDSTYADSPSRKAWSEHDAVLRVGIGTSWDARRDAFTVYKDGRVCTADGLVSRCGDEDHVAAGGRREKEEALPGIVDELKEKVASLMGKETKARDKYAVASGHGTSAEGYFSTAMGDHTTAQSHGEVVLGRYNRLSDNSFADSPSPHAWSPHDAVLRVGVGTSENDRKDALSAFKDGHVCTLDGWVSRCGDGHVLAAEKSVVDELQAKLSSLLGKDTKASNKYAVASGQESAAEGYFATAMGDHTTAQSFAEVVLGRYNELSDRAFADSPSPHAWSPHDAVLRVGIGNSESDRKDALTVFKDGRVCTADGMVSRCGDEDHVAADGRRAKEEALTSIVDELQAKVQALEAQVTTLRADRDTLRADRDEMKAWMNRVAVQLGVEPPA